VTVRIIPAISTKHGSTWKHKKAYSQLGKLFYNRNCKAIV
jgi:hypothetical protein